MLISIAEVIRRYGKLKLNKTSDDGRFEHSYPIETLIESRTTGILPQIKPDDKDLSFSYEFSELSWQEVGSNYDRYLREFEFGSTGVYKSLLKLSKKYGAICGTLFLSSEEGLVTDCAVGLSNECAAQVVGDTG